ncbi:MAG: glutamyl-tRNA reductase [Microthrixaceae bacterium]
MSFVVVGANHRTAPLELLERMSVRGDALPKMLSHLESGEHTSEAVVLATCNRTEVYLVAERFHGAFGEVRDFFSDLTFLPPDHFADSLYVHYDDQAVTHLFEVAAGLDSAVPGEHEILGQVRSAWEVARAEGASRRGLNLLFRHALEVGKRARSETAIGTHTTSVSQAAVQIASERLGSLAGRKVVVLGAGSMGRGMADFAAAEGVEELVLANRGADRAAELAAGLDADVSVAGLGELEQHLLAADVVLAATSAPVTILDAKTVRSVMQTRDKDLLIVDVALPRDVDPAVGDLDGVELLDMAAVAEITEAALDERLRETTAVRRIVDAEVARFSAAASAREVAPLVSGLHERGESIRNAELQRFSQRLEHLDETEREAVEALTKGVVAKLLHDPTVRLKDAAGSSRGDRLASSIAELFDL